jgi:hypothetical protein
MELLPIERLREGPSRIHSAECFETGFRGRSVVAPIEDAIGFQRRLTFQRRAIYATSAGTVSAAETEKLAKLWYNVHKEDHAMCVRLQAGRASDVATDGGVLSPVWGNSVRHFQTLVLDALR